MSKEMLYEDYRGRIDLEPTTTGQYMVHLAVNDGVWCKSEYRAMLQVWRDQLELLHLRGIDEVFSLIDNDEATACKFQTMFGMEPLIEFKNQTLYRSYT